MGIPLREGNYIVQNQNAKKMDQSNLTPANLRHPAFPSSIGVAADQGVKFGNDIKEITYLKIQKR